MLMSRAAILCYDRLLIYSHRAVSAVAMLAVADGVRPFTAGNGTGAFFNNIVALGILFRLVVLVFYQFADDRIDDLHRAVIGRGTAAAIADTGTAYFVGADIIFAALGDPDRGILDGHSASTAAITSELVVAPAAADACAASIADSFLYKSTITDLHIAIAAFAIAVRFTSANARTTGTRGFFNDCILAGNGNIAITAFYRTPTAADACAAIVSALDGRCDIAAGDGDRAVAACSAKSAANARTTGAIVGLYDTSGDQHIAITSLIFFVAAIGFAAADGRTTTGARFDMASVYGNMAISARCRTVTAADGRTTAAAAAGVGRRLDISVVDGHIAIAALVFAITAANSVGIDAAAVNRDVTAAVFCAAVAASTTAAGTAADACAAAIRAGIGELGACRDAAAFDGDVAGAFAIFIPAAAAANACTISSARHRQLADILDLAAGLALCGSCPFSFFLIVRFYSLAVIFDVVLDGELAL